MIRVEAENYTGVLKKNELIIHRPNEKHRLVCVAGNPKVIIIGFTCYDDSLSVLSSHPVKINVKNAAILAETVKEGRNVFTPPYDMPVFNMKEKERQPFGALQLLKIHIEELLINLLREANSEKRYDAEKHTVEIKEIIAYLNDNYLEKISIDELAFLFGTNRTTLCRIVKANTGKTVGEYVLSKKTEFAENAVVNTDKTFSEIADAMNFDGIHYFSTFFKQRTGYSPTAYRKAYGKA